MQPNANMKPRAALHQSAPSASKRAISKAVTTRPLAPRRMDCRSPAPTRELWASTKPSRSVSLMDHTPGQRQFRDEGKLRDYYRGKNGGMTDAELDVLFAKRIAYQAAHAETNHRDLVDLARARNVPLASRSGRRRSASRAIAGVGEDLRLPVELRRRARRRNRGHLRLAGDAQPRPPRRV